jgi:hypothetical protein
MIPFRRRTPLEQEMARLSASLLRVQITLEDHLSPVLRRTAYSLETFFYRAEGKWHRSQMVGAR